MSVDTCNVGKFYFVAVSFYGSANSSSPVPNRQNGRIGLSEPERPDRRALESFDRAGRGLELASVCYGENGRH